MSYYLAPSATCHSTLAPFQDPNSFGCFLDGDNIYGQFTVEIDGLYGPCAWGEEADEADEAEEGG